MEGKILQNLGLMLALSCVIIVAKNESERTVNESKNMNSILNTTNLNQNIFTEGGTKVTSEVDISEEPKKSKVKGRKGVSFEDLKSETSNTSVTVQTNISSSNSNETSKLVTNTPIANKTVSAEISHPASSSSFTTTVKSTVKSTTISSTTTTKKPIRKPTITYSADEDDAIKESEKNINYNVGKEKVPEEPAPKLEQDVDRTVLEEKRARKSYMIYLGLAVVLPLSVVALNLAYKRVKTYLELREYQRVDFLVDGMYVS